MLRVWFGWRFVGLGGCRIARDCYAVIVREASRVACRIAGA